MAITVNTAGASAGMPTAPQRVIELDVDLDASYPTGGYDVAASLPQSPTLVSPFVAASNGTTPIYLRINPATLKLQAFVDDTFVEVAGAVDLATYTGVKVHCFSE